MRAIAVWLACAVPLCALAQSTAGPLPLPPPPPKDPKVFASLAGLVDLNHGLLFFTEASSNVARARGDERGPAGTLVALRLADGKKLWRNPGVAGPLYAVDDLVVAWADDAHDEVLAVLDAMSGKVLRRIDLGERAKPPTGPAPPCARPAVNAALTTLYGGRGHKLERVTSFYSCPNPGWGGARRSDEEIAAWQAKCTSWIRGTRWDLDTGVEEPIGRKLDPNLRQVESLPLLDARGLSFAGVEIVPGADALNARRPQDKKTVWSVPYPGQSPDPSRATPCPDMP